MPQPFSSTQPPLKKVALLLETSSSWGRRIIQGAAGFARQHAHWQMFTEPRGIEERLRVPTSWKGDGIIARVTSSAMALELSSLRIPVVNVSGVSIPEARFPKITTDMTSLAEMALQHFLDRGFQNFAYFSLRGVSYVATQCNAFVTASEAAGARCSVFELKSQYGAEPDWNSDLDQIGEWLRKLELPVGILAWNASCGRAIAYAAQTAGLMVPEEIAIVTGADDDLLCEYLHPPLSGIVVDAMTIGFRAAELLQGLMEDKKARKGRKLEQLIPPLRVETRQSSDTLAIKDPALIKALSFIRQNVSAQFQVADIARHAGVSRRVLERRFLKVLGRSPAEEIRRCHLEYAKHLLQETSQPIPFVAESAGFCSPEYFAYYFKSKTGMTPLQFRKQHGATNLRTFSQNKPQP